MIRNLAIIAIAVILQSCSTTVVGVVYNNTGEEIEICKVGITTDCQKIRNSKIGRITMLAGKYVISTESSIYSYEFKFKEHWTFYNSTQYCRRLFFVSKACDIAVQVEPDGNIYWAGKNHSLPLNEIPAQPIGFPFKGVKA